MGDIRDIVMGSDGAAPQQNELEKILQTNKGPKKRAAEAAERRKHGPRGMHRELYNLIGGRAPLAPSTGYLQQKAQLNKGPAQKWLWTEFANPARTDSLKLRHWVKSGEQSKDYAFAKLNVKFVNVPVFTEDEYSRYLQEDTWSYAETRLLFDLCRRFDLRFLVVHDRFAIERARLPRQRTLSSLARTVEDLKARYYDVCKKLKKAAGQTNSAEATYKFDHKHETARKEQLKRIMQRTREQVEQEAYLRAEFKKIESKNREKSRKGDAGRKHASKAKHDAPAPKKATRLKGTHLRSTMLNRRMTHAPKHFQQSLLKVMEEFKLAKIPLPTEKVARAYSELRNTTVELCTVLQHTELQRQEAARLRKQFELLKMKQSLVSGSAAGQSKKTKAEAEPAAANKRPRTSTS